MNTEGFTPATLARARELQADAEAHVALRGTVSSDPAGVAKRLALIDAAFEATRPTRDPDIAVCADKNRRDCEQSYRRRVLA